MRSAAFDDALAGLGQLLGPGVLLRAVAALGRPVDQPDHLIGELQPFDIADQVGTVGADVIHHQIAASAVERLDHLVVGERAAEHCGVDIALLIAVAASTAIGYFSTRLNDGMLLRASEFLGADLQIKGSTAASSEQLDTGTALGLESAQVVEFASVIASDTGIQLASVKAADNAYPLRGQLRSAATPYGPEQPGEGPQAGEAWVEVRLLNALNLEVGDNLEVGRKLLRISRVLTYEPDRAGDFYSLAPHLLMHLDDLAATDIVQPGSRVTYRLLWRGEAAALARYREAVTPGLQAQQKLEDARDGNAQRLIRRPEHAVHWRGSYQLDSWSVFVTGDYQSKTRQGPFDPVAQLPAFTLWGLGAQLDLSTQAVLRLKIDNLSDKQHQTVAGYNSYGITGSLSLSYVLP